MSDILIKGMEMPTSCEDCPFGWYTRTGEKFCLTMIRGWQSNCPLAPVPKHGRLIDADALTKDLVKRWNVNDDQDFCNKEVWRGIEDAPTVIEAEEGE